MAIILAIGIPTFSKIVIFNLDKAKVDLNSDAVVTADNTLVAKIISRNLHNNAKVTVKYAGYSANEASDITNFVVGLSGNEGHLVYVDRINLANNDVLDRFSATIGTAPQYYAMDNHGRFFAYPGTTAEFSTANWEKRALFKTFKDPEFALKYLSGELIFPFDIRSAIDSANASATFEFSVLTSIKPQAISNTSYPITFEVDGHRIKANLTLKVIKSRQITATKSSIAISPDQRLSTIQANAPDDMLAKKCKLHYVGAPWCRICHTYKTFIFGATVCTNPNYSVTCREYDFDTEEAKPNKGINRKYGIETLPTVLVWSGSDDTFRKKMVGDQKEEVKKVLDEFCKAPSPSPSASKSPSVRRSPSASPTQNRPR